MYQFERNGVIQFKVVPLGREGVTIGNCNWFS
jgi:hypothetical protein